MSKLKLVRSSGQPWSEELNRVQQFIQQEFDATAPPVSTIVSVRNDYMARETDNVVFVDASAGPVRVTLPAAGKSPAIIVKTDSSANAVTVQAGNAATIAGGTSLVAVGSQSYVYNPATKGWFQI